MTPRVVWIVLGVLYVVFFSWYTSFGGPLTDEEVERYLGFWRSIRADYAVYEDSVQEVLVAILCSPEFLYLCEFVIACDYLNSKVGIV